MTWQYNAWLATRLRVELGQPFIKVDTLLNTVSTAECAL